MLREYFQDIIFERPWAFALLLIVPFYILQFFLREGPPASTMQVSMLSPLTRSYNLKTTLRKLPEWLRLFSIIFIVIALAAPYRLKSLEINKGKGLEIVLCLDVSGSMLARDFKPDRLRASLQVARDFLKSRKGDKIGLVVFSGQSLTLCPITTDHEALLQQLESINYGILADGTSIGSGLASSVERLRLSKAPSKIIVLLTDGEDTGGTIDPQTAKEIAKTFGIKVYTIGVGTEGFTEIPYQTNTGNTIMEKERVSIDEDLLKSIASETGGNYYRANNNSELESIYNTIDKLEKSDIQTTVFNKKQYETMPFLLLAFGLILLEWVFMHSWLRRFP